MTVNSLSWIHHLWCLVINYYDKNHNYLTLNCVYVIILQSNNILFSIWFTLPNQRYPLRLNVGFLVNQPISYSRDFHFDFTNIHIHPDLDLTKLQGAVHIARTPQGLLVLGKFTAATSSECVRCLTNFEQELRIELNELYAFSSRMVSESGLVLPEDGNIDLAPVIREYLLIEMPIRPLCKPDCKGLCIICGEDLNQTTCEHQKQGNASL